MSVSINDITSAEWSLKADEFGAVVEGYDDINQSIGIIINTPKLSDPFRPLFGCDLNKYLDQPTNDAAPNMVNSILEALRIWETRIEVTQVDYTINEENITFSIYWTLIQNNQKGVATVVVSTAALDFREAVEAPFNLSGVIQNDLTIKLSWEFLNKTNEVYQIFRSKNGGAFQLIGISSDLQFTDNNVDLFTIYSYRVRAAKGQAVSVFSNTITITVDVPVINFNTTWNSAVDGALNMNIVTSDGSTGTWILPDNSRIETNNLFTSSPSFDGNNQLFRLLISDFSKITDINSKISGSIGSRLFGKLDLSKLIGLNGSIDFRNNEIEEFIFDDTTAKTIDSFTIFSNNTAPGYILDLNSYLVDHGGGVISMGNVQMKRFVTGTGDINSFSCITFSGNNQEELDFSNSRINGNVDIAINLGNTSVLDTIIFSTLANNGNRIRAWNTSVVDFDFTNCAFSEYSIRNNSLTETLILGNAAHSLEELNALVISSLTSFNIGGAIVDSNTTLITFASSGLPSSLIDNIYIQIAGAYDGVSDLSGLTINTSGNSAPTSLSDGARQNLADQNANIIT